MYLLLKKNWKKITFRALRKQIARIKLIQTDEVKSSAFFNLGELQPNFELRQVLQWRRPEVGDDEVPEGHPWSLRVTTG